MNPLFPHQDLIVRILREDGESNVFDITDRLKSSIAATFDHTDVSERLSVLVASGIVASRTGKNLVFYRVNREGDR